MDRNAEEKQSDFQKSNDNPVPAEEKEVIVAIEHADCTRVIRGKKAKLTKKVEKTYTVTVSYVHLSDEEKMNKRAILESIIKKPPVPNDH